MILFIYEDNFVLAEIVNCNNADENCYHLNELLAPCYYKINFNSIFYVGSVGLGKYNKRINTINYTIILKMIINIYFLFFYIYIQDTLVFSRCVCSKEFYSSLVACGNTCNFPVDAPIKFESDCKIQNQPVDVDG